MSDDYIDSFYIGQASTSSNGATSTSYDNAANNDLVTHMRSIGNFKTVFYKIHDNHKNYLF